MAATKSFSSKKKKFSIKTMLGIAVSGIALLGLVSAAILANMNQDTRQQAAGIGQSKYCEAAGGRCVKDTCGNGYVETDGKCANKKRPVCCMRPSASLMPQPSSSVSPYPWPSSSASPYPQPSSSVYPTPYPSPYPTAYPATPMPTWNPYYPTPSPSTRPLRPRPSSSLTPEPSVGPGNYRE